jgi:integrase
MKNRTSRPSSKPWLRDQAVAGIASPDAVGTIDQLEPVVPVTSHSTLAEFFEGWFLPVVLSRQEAAAGTIRNYREAITWWTHLTGDPPIGRIDDLLVASFVEGLRVAGFRRGPNAELRRLSHNSIAKTLRTLRAVLSRLGPRIQPTKATARLLPETPIVPPFKAVFKRKGTFSLAQARAVAGACDLMQHPRTLPEQFPIPNWWKARLALLYFTGLRRGTAFELRWRHVERDGDRWWLNVPGSLVPKTGKSTRIAAHPQLVAILRRMHWRRGEHHLLTPAVHVDHFATLHHELQRKAGLPVAECYSSSVWRRLHGQQIGELGLAIGESLAQVSLDHSDLRTTSTHYVELVNELRLKLPPLWGEYAFDHQQRLLF